MRKIIGLLIIGFVFYSCTNNNKVENKSIEEVAINKNGNISERKIPNDDATKKIAFIELTDYNYQDSDDYGKSSEVRKLIIKGITNLPEKTIIKIDIGSYVPSTKEEDANDTYGSVNVINGKFEINLNPWNIPQTITFRIFKDEQPNQVLEIIGQSGDKLKLSENNKGKYPSICFFQNIVNINEQIIAGLKNGKKPTYPFQTANNVKHPSEKALANFINAWKKKNWSDMLKYTQHSQNETIKSLENSFDLVEVIGFEILNKKKNPDEYVKNWYSIEYRLNIKPMISHKGIQTKIITANIINENGHWGVNATSATSGLYK